VGDLHLLGMRKQVVIDSSGEDRRLHGDHPELGNGADPAIQLAAALPDLALLVHTASCIPHAIADRLLVYIKCDEVHSL
jgi:hypothetical protein